MADNGGPAFPWDEMDRDSAGDLVLRHQWPGKSLRDYFAGQTIVGAAGRHNHPARMAHQAYQIADAMLEQRAVPAPTDPAIPMLLKEMRKCRNVLASVRDTLNAVDEYGAPRPVKLAPIEDRIAAASKVLNRLGAGTPDEDEEVPCSTE